MRQIQKIGAWQIAVDTEPFEGWFTAWGKMGPITGDGPIDEPGEHVWCQSARSPEEAVKRLREELAI